MGKAHTYGVPILTRLTQNGHRPYNKTVIHTGRGKTYIMLIDHFPLRNSVTDLCLSLCVMSDLHNLLERECFTRRDSPRHDTIRFLVSWQIHAGRSPGLARISPQP